MTELVEIVETAKGPWLCLRSDHNAQSRRSGNLGHEQEINWLREVLSGISQPVFLDIGAHNGLFSLQLHDLCRQIYAWEPQRIVFNLLAGTVALNSWTNVFVHNEALGDADGMIPVPTYDYSEPANFGGVWFGELDAPKQNVGQERKAWNGDLAPIKRLDSYTFPKVDAIKIDVEGMEMDVLRGGSDTIRKFHPAILIEHCVTGIGVLSGWLEAEGYTCCDLGGDLACIVRPA